MLDTSTYVAALLSETGGAAAIFKRILQQDVLNFYTPEILTEVREVLARPKFNVSNETQNHFLHLISESSYEVKPADEFRVALCRDPSDDKFLSLARQIDADFLVSLDQDLLTLKKTGKTTIGTPKDYLTLNDS